MRFMVIVKSTPEIEKEGASDPQLFSRWASTTKSMKAGVLLP